MQAGTRAVLKKRIAAIANQEQLLQVVERLAHRAAAGIRPEVTPLAGARPAVETQPRKRMVGGDVDVGVALVVPQQDVEPRLVLLDQVVFEQQRLRFGVGHRHLDARHELHHRGGLCRRLRAMKVARHPFFQVPRLADIDDLVLRVEHAIHAGAMGQRAQEGFRVECGGLAHALFIQHPPGLRKYGVEHRGRQAAGVGVVAAAVVRVEHAKIAQVVIGCVCELVADLP